MRKALVIATSAAVAFAGLTAMPASAAGPAYATGSALFTQEVNVSTELVNNEVTIPAGVGSVTFNYNYNVGQQFLTANVGKVFSVETKVYDENNVELTGVNGGPMGGSYSTISFCDDQNNCDRTNWEIKTITAKATHTNGYINVDVSANMAGDMMSESMEPLPAGKYRASVKLLADGVEVVPNADQGGLSKTYDGGRFWIEKTSTYKVGANVRNVSMNLGTCVDSAKIAVGDVVTVKGYVNDVDQNINAFNIYNMTRADNSPSPRNGASNGILINQNDIDYGLALRTNVNLPQRTEGTTYTANVEVVDQDGNDVTGDCAPPAPVAPTATVGSGNSISATVASVKFADRAECAWFVSTDLTKVVATSQMQSGMMPNSAETCTFTQGTPGLSYVAKIRGVFYGVNGAYSPASNEVKLPIPGYTISPAVSGGDTGGQATLINDAVTAVVGAGQIRFLADGKGGTLRLSTTTTQMACPPCGPSSSVFKLQQTTANGLVSTFAGTGSVDWDPIGENAGFANLAWYGTAADKWSLASSNYSVPGFLPQVEILQGTNGAAATTTTSVAGSVFNAVCAGIGAGFVSKSSAMNQNNSVSVTPVSAATAKQLFMLQCYKPTTMADNSTAYLATPVLVTVENATTVNVVKVLSENSNAVNAATAVFTPNASAGASDSVLTLFVTKKLVTGLTMMNGPTVESGNVAGREIVRLKADLTSTTTTAGWDPGTTTIATEPRLTIPQVNDGSFYVIYSVTVDAKPVFKLIKIGATGAASTAVSITNDKSADMVNASYVLPIGLQSGSLTDIILVASTMSSYAPLSVKTATGEGKAGEIVKFTSAPSIGITNSVLIDSANKNLYWWFSSAAATEAGKVSLVKWIDPLYVKPVGPVPAVTSKNLEYATNTPAAGTKVTFTGTNLNLATAVKFGTVAATLGTKTATSLEVTVPAGTGTVAITIESANGNAAGGNFTYVGANKVAQTVTLDAGANTAAVGDADRTLSATVAMTGYTAVASLTYSSTTAAVCTVTGNKLKFVGKGTCSVKATQAGSSWTAEGVATKDITVTGPDAQTITVKAPSTGEKLVGLDGYFIYPSTNSGLPLSIRFDTPTVCKKGTFAANHVINVKTGTCKITVLGAGNAQWMAGSTVLTYTVGKAGTTAITDAGNVTAPVVLNNNGTKTNVLSEVVSWKKSTGALTVSSRGVWVGPITATATFTVSGKKYTCTLNYGTLKAAAATSVKGFPATTALCGGKSTSDKAALAALKSISAPVTVKIVVVRDLRDPAKYTVKGQKVTRAVYVTIG
jgi:hypothetical protein